MSPRSGSSREKMPDTKDPAAIYADLRRQALSWTPAQIGVAEPGDAVYGVLMDMGLGDGAAATIVAMADGTASMYTGTGGGVLGAGDHPAVAAAAKALVKEADGSRDLLSADWQDGPLADGYVRLIALTPSGTRAASGEGDVWIDDESEMQPVFAAANHLIFRLRSVSMPG